MFKVGDKVIITKNISNIYKQKAIVTHNGYGFCRVTRPNSEDTTNDSCNIFYNHTGESIEYDIEEIRNDKLKILFLNN
jgi:hypothetical protein